MTVIGADVLKRAAETVYQYMTPTAQINWPLLSARVGAEVFVKHENHTPIGAFKVRGGLVYLDRLRRDNPDITTVITATRGNHGQSIACAAGKLGFGAKILVPHCNNPEKNAAMRAFGAEVIEVGHDFQASLEEVHRMVAEDDALHMIPPFHENLVSGVATYSLEFLMQVPDLDTVYVPIGMGSGICGMITARDCLKLDVKIVGVVAKNAPAYALSFRAGKKMTTNRADTIADGMACRVPDDQALDIIMRGVERIVEVDDDEILRAMKYYVTDTHNLAEGAAAAPLAALLQEHGRMAQKRVGLVHSGGNVDQATMASAMALED